MDTHNIDAPFHHLQHVRIVFNINYSFENAHLLRMCGRLQSVEFVHWDSFEMRRMKFDTLLNFIEGNPMICDLHVRLHSGNGKVDVMPSETNRLINEHAPLVKLHLDPYVFTADDATKMMQELNSLKEFRFQLSNQLQYDRFVAQLDSGWQVSDAKLHGSKQIITVKR